MPITMIIYLYLLGISRLIVEDCENSVQGHCNTNKTGDKKRTCTGQKTDRGKKQIDKQ